MGIVRDIEGLVDTLRRHVTYANVTATLAVVLALAGVSYAAVKLAPHSVGTRNLKDGAVTEAKIDSDTLSTLRGEVGLQGPAGSQGPTGNRGATGQQGAIGPQGSPGAN